MAKAKTKKIKKPKREKFSGKFGFVMAAAASAVGLGNIWRFPYLAAKYGGAIFLIIYIALAVTFGFTLMVTEIAIGRKTGLSAIGAYKALNKRFSFIGWLTSVVPMLILPYYCVIGGWICKYATVFFGGHGAEAAGNVIGSNGQEVTYFADFISRPLSPLLWFALFLGLTAVVVFLGVEKSIEKFSKIIMPALIALVLFVAIYTMFMPGAIEGVKFYLLPDFSAFSMSTVLAAMGQLFYSMSLAMGIMITYGSYMNKDVSIQTSARQISFFDTGIAFFAGLAVIPAVFVGIAAGQGSIENLQAGPSLIFITLPGVFNKMSGGQVIGTLFFVLVLFAAITSSISIMEAVVSNICDKFHIKRKVACWITIGIAVLLGIPCSLGYGPLSGVSLFGLNLLDFFDYVTNNLIMPIVALLTCIFIGYITKPKTIIQEVEITQKFKEKKFYSVVIKYIAPICIVLILVSSVFMKF